MDIASLLGSYAFPIVACVAMGWYVMHITDKNKEDTTKLNDQHTKVMLAFKDELKDAINNNTLVMQHLCDILDVRSKKTKKKGDVENEAK